MDAHAHELGRTAIVVVARVLNKLKIWTDRQRLGHLEAVEDFQHALVAIVRAAITKKRTAAAAPTSRGTPTSGRTATQTYCNIEKNSMRPPRPFLRRT